MASYHGIDAKLRRVGSLNGALAADNAFKVAGQGLRSLAIAIRHDVDEVASGEDAGGITNGSKEDHGPREEERSQAIHCDGLFC